MSIQQLVMAAGGKINDATGGTITYDGDYQIHTFTSSGTFTVTLAGAPSTYVEFLMTGGGNNGSSGSVNSGGVGGNGGQGGGGAQIQTSAVALTLSSFGLNYGYPWTVAGVGGTSVLTYAFNLFTCNNVGNSGGVGGAGGFKSGGSESIGFGQVGVTGTASTIAGTGTVYYGSSGGGGGGGTGFTGVAVGLSGTGGTGAGNGGTGGASNSAGSTGIAATGYGNGGGGGGGAGGTGGGTQTPGAGGAGSPGVIIVRFKYRNI
jgi:hypothetical protein